jgi:peptidoglycan/LPS O-acetylase OafA/YrhL
MSNRTEISQKSGAWFTRGLFSPVLIRDGHDNFFTPIRLLLACLVVVGHAAVIAYRDINAEPHLFFHYGFSYLAVNAFFIASGFLVTKSIAYRRNLSDFSSARVLRIYPALLVHVLFLMFIIGPLATMGPLWDYLTHSEVWKQPFLVLSFVNTDVLLPGVFSANEEQFGSAPLWTLRYELLAYIATGIAFALGLMRKKWMILAQFIVPSIAWLITKELGIFDALPGTVQNAMRFGIAYGLGATIFAYKDRLRFSLGGLAVVVIFTVLTAQSEFLEIGTNILLAYTVMLFAYAKSTKLAPLQSLSDISYGVYIYHWCVLQLTFQWFPSMNMWELLLVGGPVTWALATLSWHWVEKPALKVKAGFAKRLRLGKSKPKFAAKPVLLD